MKENGGSENFDGFLGFSQGACLVSLLCTSKAMKEVDFSPKFAICMSGYLSNLEAHEEFYASGLSSSTLLFHTFGVSDKVVHPKYSALFSQEFSKTSSCKSVVHDFGHVIPRSDVVNSELTNFISSVGCI
jgi:predicted esterase